MERCHETQRVGPRTYPIFEDGNLKYNYQDHFDLLTIKHEYLKDTSHVEQDYIERYLPIAHITANLMYDKFQYVYGRAGMDIQDIKSLSIIYLVGYLAKYGFRYNQDSYNKYADKFLKSRKREPSEAEANRAERNEIITFIRHKLNNCSMLCERKSRNIVVARNRKTYYAKVSPEADNAKFREIMEGHKDYRKVTVAEFKEAKKKAKKSKAPRITDENGCDILVAEYFDPGITDKDYLELILGCDTMYTTDPENLLMDMQRQSIENKKREGFEALRCSKKVEILKGFVEENRGNKNLRDELTGAKRLIKKHSFWHGHM